MSEEQQATEAEMIERIKTVIKEDITPALAMDGGGIELRGYEDGVVLVTLKGACHGCPSSAMTLEYGVQRLLQKKIPEIKGVKNVLD